MGEIYQIAAKLPNGHKAYQITVAYYKWPQNTYTNLFHSKALQNLPNWDFWFENKPSGNPARKVRPKLARFR
jgi:hypothetical protein